VCVQLFSVRYEAAKLIEEEQETELEEAERQKVIQDVAHDTRQTSRRSSEKLGDAGTGGTGGWQESESGMFWEPCDTSVLDSSSDGLAALNVARQQAAALAAGGTASSQDEDENYTKGKLLLTIVVSCQIGPHEWAGCVIVQNMTHSVS